MSQKQLLSIKFNKKYKLAFLLAPLFSLSPITVFAACGSSNGPFSAGFSIKDIIPWANPQADLNCVQSTVKKVTELGYNLIFTVCVIMIFWGAVQYLTAYGEESKLEGAKKTIIWALAGLVLVSLAGTIMGIVKGWLS